MKMKLALIGVIGASLILAACGGGKRSVNYGSNDRNDRDRGKTGMGKPGPSGPGSGGPGHSGPGPGSGGPGGGSFGSGGPGKPSQANWSRIARQEMRFAADKTRLDVRASKAPRFGELKIDIEGTTIQTFDVVVTFADGSKWTSPMTMRFPRNGDSRILRLPDNRRGIDRVSVTYRTLDRGGRATMTISGR